MLSVPLLRAVVRFEAGKVRPWMGLRNAIGTAIPVVIGAAMGQPAGGMVAGIGALNVAVADGTDPYAHRSRRMVAASLLCSLSVVVAGLTSGAWFIALILAAGAFVAGIMVAAGPAEADIGVVALVTLITFSAQPMSPDRALVSGLLALGGGLFQTALAIASWPLRRSMPERRALSALYLELARAAAAASPATEAPPASQQSTEAQQALAALDARDSVDAERFLALLSQAERIRLSLLSLARLRTRIARESGAEAVTSALEPCATLTSQVLQQVGARLLREEDADPSPASLKQLAQISTQLRNACRACSPPRRPCSATPAPRSMRSPGSFAPSSRSLRKPPGVVWLSSNGANPRTRGNSRPPEPGRRSQPGSPPTSAWSRLRFATPCASPSASPSARSSEAACTGGARTGCR